MNYLLIGNLFQPITLKSLMTYTFNHLNQNLILHHDKAIFWKEQNTLIITDLHLGKSGHFRELGIATPENIIESDLFRLNKLISEFNPKKLLILGDLFHAKYNKEWDLFKDWRSRNKNIEVILIKGNHDRHHLSKLEQVGIEQIIPMLTIQQFIFIHEPCTEYNILQPEADTPLARNTTYFISGHVHPGITLYGKARQSETLPCFYFGKEQAILPAFGGMTGRFRLSPTAADQIFAVCDNKIVELDLT